jgi:hypothetical protein
MILNSRARYMFVICHLELSGEISPSKTRSISWEPDLFLAIQIYLAEVRSIFESLDLSWRN